MREKQRKGTRGESGARERERSRVLYRTLVKIALGETAETKNTKRHGMIPFSCRIIKRKYFTFRGRFIFDTTAKIDATYRFVSENGTAPRFFSPFCQVYL